MNSLCQYCLRSFALVLGCLLAGIAAAQSPPLVPAVRDSDAVPAAATAKEQGDLNQLLATALRELAALRAEVSSLQSSFDTLMDTVVADLREENTKLRDLLSFASENPEILSDSPRENAAGFDIPPYTESTVEMPVITFAPEISQSVAPVAASGFEVIKEWGRTPETVAQLAADVSTLKGLILAVPPLSTDEELIALGESLRQEYAKYDNVNIEVFDSVAAAEEFAEYGGGDPERRVLTVSKYRQTGRDIVLLVRGESVTVIPK